MVLGLAAQESMGNFVNGLLITTFKPFKIGDLVKVNNGEYGYGVQSDFNNAHNKLRIHDFLFTDPAVDCPFAQPGT